LGFEQFTPASRSLSFSFSRAYLNLSSPMTLRPSRGSFSFFNFLAFSTHYDSYDVALCYIHRPGTPPRRLILRQRQTVGFEALVLRVGPLFEPFPRVPPCRFRRHRRSPDLIARALSCAFFAVCVDRLSECLISGSWRDYSPVFRAQEVSRPPRNSSYQRKPPSRVTPSLIL